MVELKDLPPELIEQVFLRINDPKDILSVSETCKQFNQIVDTSEGIVKKLTLHIRHPLYTSEFLAAVQHTKRRYRNISITRSRERTENSEGQFVNAFVPIAPTIKFLKLNWHPHRSIEVALIDLHRLHRPRREALVFLNHFHHRNNNNNHHHHQRVQQILPVLQQLANGHQQAPVADREGLVEDDDEVIQLAHNLGQNGNEADNDNEPDRNPIMHAPRDEIRDELYREFMAIIKQFPALERMEWNNVHVEKRTAASDLETLNFSHLKQLKLRYCDPFCFEILSTCKQSLTELEISEPFWGNMQHPPGIEVFESFLVNLPTLKVLKISNIQYPRLFHRDLTPNIRFQLNHLVLNNVFFKDKAIAEKFFKTQTQLKSIDFQIKNEKLRNLDEVLWYNNIMRTLFLQNPMLSSVKLEKMKYKIDNCDFITSITNTSVQELCFNVTAEEKNAEFFKQLLRVFPNLKKIQYKSEESDDRDGDVCFERGTTLEKCKSLSIINCSVHSLININAENLECFEYSPKLNGQFIDDYIGGFLHTHRGIKHLIVGSKTDKSYFFVSYILCELIVNFLNHLESITIYNFAEVNKSVKLLCTLRNLKSLTLSTSQYQQFTAKTKVECERMKLKLIPVEISHLREPLEFPAPAPSTPAVELN